MLEAKDLEHKLSSVLQKKKGFQKNLSGRSPKKKVFKIFFRRSPAKNVLQNFFQAIYKISTIQKKCCPRAEDRTIFEDLRPRGQGLQNVSSRTPPLLNIIVYSRTYDLIKSKGEFTQYPFFVRFRPFFYVFTSP